MSHRFRVWAPRPQAVELVVGERRLAMQPTAGGWWSLDVDDAGPETDYAYSLDAGPALPDPRSEFQPAGVDGPSRVVDHTRHGWQDRHWAGVHLPTAVLYELHIGTFTPQGTFAAACEKLPLLRSLGVDAVELMPVAEFGGRRGWGYDGVDLFAPHHAYGGPDGLKGLVDACHRAGLGVVLDVVYNHLGPTGNYLNQFGPYFDDDTMTNWGPAVNLDGPGSDEVRRFLIDNARYWLEHYRIDGLRIDAAHALRDQSALSIHEALSAEVHAVARRTGVPRWIIAESDLNDPRFVRSPELGGYGYDAAWADEFHHALHARLTGERDGYYEDFGETDQVVTALRRAWVYAGEYSPHRQRVHGRPPTGLGPERFAVSLQNHDQVGNRATGDRIHQQASIEAAMAGAALLLLSPYVPMLFAGEEWAASAPFRYFTDHPGEELAEAIRTGRRSEFVAFGWDPESIPDPQAEATFQSSILRWEERDDPVHARVLAWYRTLIQLRRRIPPGTPTEVGAGDDGRWVRVQRGPLAVVVNLGDDTVRIPRASGCGVTLASAGDVTADATSLTLGPLAVVVCASTNDDVVHPTL